MMEHAWTADGEPPELRLSRLAAELQATTAADEANAGGAQHAAPPKLESGPMPIAAAAFAAALGQSAPPAAGDSLPDVAAAAMPTAARGRAAAAAAKGDESDDSCIVLSSSPPSEDDEAAGIGRASAKTTVARRSYALRSRPAAPPAAQHADEDGAAQGAGAAAAGVSEPGVVPAPETGVSAAQPLLGARVMVPFVDVDGKTRLFPGKIEHRVAGRGACASYRVVFDDGDEAVVSAEELRTLQAGKDVGESEAQEAAGARAAGGSKRGAESPPPKPHRRSAADEPATKYHGVSWHSRTVLKDGCKWRVKRFTAECIPPPRAQHSLWTARCASTACCTNSTFRRRRRSAQRWPVAAQLRSRRPASASLMLLLMLLLMMMLLCRRPRNARVRAAHRRRRCRHSRCWSSCRHRGRRAGAAGGRPLRRRQRHRLAKRLRQRGLRLRTPPRSRPPPLEQPTATRWSRFCAASLRR